MAFPPHSSLESSGPGPVDPDLTPIRALVQGLVDYAGLFPPAKLDMAKAARSYADFLRSPDSWMLGRFICPVSRLEEFRAATVELLPRQGGRRAQHAMHGGGGGPDQGDNGVLSLAPDVHPHHADEAWPISAIIDGDLDEDLDSVFAFNGEHSHPDKGLAVVDAIEIKVPAGGGSGAAVFIDESLDLVPEEIYPFFEIPVLPEKAGGDAPDVRGAIAALSGSDAGAKIRMGGITPDSFPEAARVAEFIVACAAADVPFKATAGLHHAMRGEHPLTYEPGCPRGTMHGFVNLFMAAALVRAQRLDARGAAEVLMETDPRAFAFGENVVSWRGRLLDTTQIGLVRETFALSYGSCSFEEPVRELRALGLV